MYEHKRNISVPVPSASATNKFTKRMNFFGFKFVKSSMWKVVDDEASETEMTSSIGRELGLQYYARPHQFWKGSTPGLTFLSRIPHFPENWGFKIEKNITAINLYLQYVSHLLCPLGTSRRTFVAAALQTRTYQRRLYTRRILSQHIGWECIFTVSLKSSIKIIRYRNSRRMLLIA